MKIKILKTLVAAVLLAGASDGLVFSGVADPVLFDNGTSSGDQPGIFNENEHQRLYDDFVLSGPSIITGLFWQQHDLPGFVYGATRITIYSGTPEITPALFTADIAANRSPNATGVVFGKDGFDYSVDGLSIPLPAGTYWLGLNTLGLNTTWDTTLGTIDSIPGFQAFNPGQVLGFGNLAFRVTGVVVASDADHDGVPDALDLCPDSDLRPTVWIGGCDSGVSNDIDGALVDADGCSLADYLAHQLTTAATGARNHGRFVSTMARYLNALVRSGIITGAEHEALMSCIGSANRSDFLLP